MTYRTNSFYQFVDPGFPPDGRGGGSKMVLFSPKMPINGRTVPGIVYNLNRRIRGLTDSSHTGLNNFSPTRSPPSWQGRPKMVLFWTEKKPIMAGQFRAEFMFQLGGSEV